VIKKIEKILAQRLGGGEAAPAPSDEKKSGSFTSFQDLAKALGGGEADDGEPAEAPAGVAVSELERVVQRTADIGVLPADLAISYGCTGPVLRGSGVKRDLRKEEPYLCFADNWDGDGAEAVRFSVPVSSAGDCYSRFLVRLEELRQSRSIIHQLIDDLPTGPVDQLAEGKTRIPPKGDVYGSIEATIQHFELFMTNRGWDTPVGEAYGAIESPNGELGFFIVGDGTKNPWRAGTRPPAIYNFQVFSKMLEGHQLADLVAVLGSLNIIAAELDR